MLATKARLKHLGKLRQRCDLTKARAWQLKAFERRLYVTGRRAGPRWAFMDVR